MNRSGTKTREVKCVCEHLLDQVQNCFAFISEDKIFDRYFYFLPSAVVPSRCSEIRLDR